MSHTRTAMSQTTNAGITSSFKLGRYIRDMTEWLVEETIAYNYAYFRRYPLQSTVGKQQQQQQKGAPHQQQELHHTNRTHSLPQHTDPPPRQLLLHQANPTELQCSKKREKEIFSTFEIDFEDELKDFGVFNKDLGYLIYTYVVARQTKELQLLKWAKIKLELTEELMRKNLPRHSTPPRCFTSADDTAAARKLHETRELLYMKEMRRYKSRLVQLVELLNAKTHRLGRRKLLKKCAELSGVTMNMQREKRLTKFRKFF